MSEFQVNSATTTPRGPVCWPSGLAAAIPREQAEELAVLFKAIADPARLQILSLVGSGPGAEVCSCDLTAALDLAQPTVSHHLKVLVDAGLLSREKRGTWAYFRLVPDQVERLAYALTAAVAEGPPGHGA